MVTNSDAEDALQTEMTGNLIANQAVIINGPGVIKVNAAKTITVTQAANFKIGAGKMGTLGAVKFGPALHLMGPMFGFTLLSAGTLLLAKWWLQETKKNPPAKTRQTKPTPPDRTPSC